MNLLYPSSLHANIPTDCARPNVVVNLEQIDYPCIFGTGFFAHRGQELYYFTALHCALSNPASSAIDFNSLLIPYNHTGVTSSPDHFVKIEAAYTVESYINGENIGPIDLIACPVSPPKCPSDFLNLLHRSARLPKNSKWLADYSASSTGMAAIKSGDLAVCIIGFPKNTHKNKVSYSTSEDPSIISTEAVLVHGTVATSSLDGHLKFTPSSYPHRDFSGFSGAPVFARISSDAGPQYALIGMVSCGSSTYLNFLQIGRLVEATIQAP